MRCWPKPEAAKALLLEGHTWQHVAQRAARAALSWQEAQQDKGDKPANRLAWISSWGTRCGIATLLRAFIGSRFMANQALCVGVNRQ
jgi:hypothetical protein